MPIEHWSEGPADANMHQSILLKLGRDVHKHPWWQARTRLVLELLRRQGLRPPASVLDAGCGWGSTYLQLHRDGFEVVGSDISRQMLQRLDAPDRRLAECDLTQPRQNTTRRFDAALLLDVIEHIDDDSVALINLVRLVKPGGLVVVSVPALPRLWSEFDAIQGHRRRYTQPQLRASIEAAGLATIDMLWWGQWMVRVLARRCTKKRALPGESIDQTYARYLSLPPWPGPLLLKLAFARDHLRTIHRRNTTGTSLVAVCRVPHPVAEQAGGATPTRTSPGPVA